MRATFSRVFFVHASSAASAFSPSSPSRSASSVSSEPAVDGVKLRARRFDFGFFDAGEGAQLAQQAVDDADQRLRKPHPANPPTKRPLVSLMKQARGFGVGVVVATQNPMDLDYRALSNAGLWCIGRLQTDADRARVLDGLAAAHGTNGLGDDLGSTLQRLAPRWFVVRNARAAAAPILMQPRYAMSLLRGPMTRMEIRAARGVKDGGPAATVDPAAPIDPWQGPQPIAQEA